MSNIFYTSTLILLVILATSYLGDCIRCYQCSSDQDKKNDLCGAYKPFNKSRHVSVDCQSDEAVTPGIFCVKIVEQGPRGFIWDGRWRNVIRRCASVSETGVTGYCNWGHHANGVYWEECYCSEDQCNGATIFGRSFGLSIICIIVSFTVFYY
uniref:Uncharacterized protein n=1 Tax=Strigamia maritima TaxID=126957 RepID=T1IWU1_STRMM